MLMDFFTHCWKKRPLESGGGVPYQQMGWYNALQRWAVLVVIAMASALPVAASADSMTTELTAFELERTEEGLFLSATVKFDLPSVVDDVLHKGIPVFFVAEAELRRDRWYWYDKRVVTVARHMRLAFQPLLRRWRLQVSANPMGNNGLGVTLSQNFDSLPDAMAAIQRFSRWKIADPAGLDADGRFNVDFQFRLDVSQLPRPFQIGALGQSEWSLAVSRNQKVPAEAAR